MNTTQADKRIGDEIQEIMSLLNKYATQDKWGTWLKLRRDVLVDKTGLWIDKKKGLIDLTTIADALWDAAGTVSKGIRK
jgi:hypothetical protein